VSLNPFDSLDPKFSWSLHAAYGTLARCLFCRRTQISGSGGLAFDFFSKKITMFALAELALDASERGYKDMNIGPGAVLGLIVRPTRQQTWTASASSFTNINRGLAHSVSDYQARTLYVYHAMTQLDLSAGWNIASSYQNNERLLQEAVLGAKHFF
jgi:hypothetical protein